MQIYGDEARLPVHFCVHLRGRRHLHTKVCMKLGVQGMARCRAAATLPSPDIHPCPSFRTPGL